MSFLYQLKKKIRKWKDKIMNIIRSVSSWDNSIDIAYNEYETKVDLGAQSLK